MNDLKDLLKLAETAAAAAGEALLANRVQWGVIEDVQGREVKIGGDKHAEEIVLTAIQRESDYPIISEEAAGRAPCSAATASSGPSIRSMAA